MNIKIDFGITPCTFSRMPMNLTIDDKLLLKAHEISGKKTTWETVNEALGEYVRRREQKKIVELFGTVDYFEGYNPKTDRD